jgi:hypothetical protein
MNKETLHNDHLLARTSESGSKIPITVIEAVYRDPEDRSIILYRETAVISGHNIPNEQLEQIKIILRSKLKLRVEEGNLNEYSEPIRRTIGI